MNWTRTALVTVALGAVAAVSAYSFRAHASAPPSSSPAAPVSLAASSDYTVATTASGSGMSVAITVGGDWHVNKAYPIKFNKVPVDAARITYKGSDAENPTAVTVVIPDATSGTLKFGYCKVDGSSCAFGEVPVSL